MESEIPEGETLSREYLANERTLLSWVRTGVNAISVGILLDTVVRALSIFSYDSSSDNLPVLSPGREKFAVVGTGMVVFGAFVEVVAVARFVQYKRAIRRTEFTSSSLVYLLVALGLLLFGAAYILYALVA